jgi:glycosyltransferase involved in cell wall biosynthesis
MPSRNYSIASYCSSPAWGGLEMNVLCLVRWMTEHDWSVRFYGPADTRLHTEVKQLGLQTAAIDSRLKAGDLVNAWRLARVIRRDGVRRLIVHQSRDLFMGVMACLLTGGRCRLVYSQHMHIGVNKHDWYHRWLYGRIEAMITPARWLADRVLEKTSVPKEKLHVVTWGIEVDRFTTKKTRKIDKQDARIRFGLPNDATVIGLVGRLDPKKGQDIAIEALALVHAAGHPAHLLIVGDQSFGEGSRYTDRVYQMVTDLKLTEFVHFFPHQDKIEAVYAALDIFVLASKSECYGMVTVEALVCGLPVIGTNDGGTISLIDHGRNGLRVEPFDAGDLATNLIDLLNDDSLRERLARTALEESAERFDHHRQCRAWGEILDAM